MCPCLSVRVPIHWSIPRLHNHSISQSLSPLLAPANSPDSCIILFSNSRLPIRAHAFEQSCSGTCVGACVPSLLLSYTEFSPLSTATVSLKGFRKSASTVCPKPMLEWVIETRGEKRSGEWENVGWSQLGKKERRGRWKEKREVKGCEGMWWDRGDWQRNKGRDKGWKKGGRGEVEGDR